MWEWAFQIIVYSAFLICIFAAIRIWVYDGWKQGLWQFGVLFSLAILYWLLESWAHFKAPFYTYPNVFTDMIPHFNFGTTDVTHRCVSNNDWGISPTVPLLEASLTFGFMWTARLLVAPSGILLTSARALFIPLMTALAGLAVDVHLDPVVANSCDCSPVAAPYVCVHEGGVEREHAGLGFWDWYAEPEPNGEDLFRDEWFGVPMFNYAIWYCAPTALVALAVLLGWVGPLPSAVAAVLQAILVFAFGLAAISAPLSQPPDLQAILVALAIIFSLVLIVVHWGIFKRDNPVRWEFIVPAAAFSIFPLLALLSGDRGIVVWSWLLPVSLLATALTLFYLIAPYWKK